MLTLVVCGIVVLLSGLMVGAMLGAIAVEAAARSTREAQTEEIMSLRTELARRRHAARMEQMRRQVRDEAQWMREAESASPFVIDPDSGAQTVREASREGA